MYYPIMTSKGVICLSCILDNSIGYNSSREVQKQEVTPLRICQIFYEGTFYVPYFIFQMLMNNAFTLSINLQRPFQYKLTQQSL